jgi:MFS transporter, DHA2 family, methylenomycin A resistance protein
MTTNRLAPPQQELPLVTMSVVAPTTAVLLDAVPGRGARTAGAVFNTSRQVGGALAVAVFGALLASPGGFVSGLHLSLIIAALVAVLVAAAPTRLTTTRHPREEPP